MSARRMLLRYAGLLTILAAMVLPAAAWAAPAAPTVTKGFDGVTPANVGTGATSRLTIAITNNDGGTVFNTAFTDTYPAGLVNAATPNVTTSAGCGGTVTVTATAGAGSLSLAGATTIASGATCTVGVDVTSSSSASYLNSVTVTVCGNASCPAAQQVTGTGSAQLNVIGRYESVRVSTDADASGTATVGDTLEWSVFFHNPSGGSAIASFQATDAVGANMTVTTTPTLTYTPGGCSTGAANGSFNGVGNTNLFAAGFALNANCTVRADFRVSVSAGADGTTLSDQASGSGTGLAAILTDNVDTTTTGLPAGVTPTAGSIAQTQTAAISATTVAIPQRPTVAKSFSPATIGVRGTSQLTITLGNANASAITLTSAFTDTLPTGLVVATPNGLAGTCPGGSVTAAAGSSTITYANGASIAASGSCTIQVDVLNNASTDATVANAAGIYTNTIAAGGLQTSAGTNAAAANASLNVLAGHKSARVQVDADGSGSATPGDTLQWSVFYSNPSGGSAVSSFQVTDTVPASMTVTATPTLTYTPGGCSAGSANGSFNGVGNTNLFAAAFTLNANCTVRVDYSVTLATAAGGTTVGNQATGSGTGLSAVLTDNIDTTTTGLPSGVTPTAGSVAQTQNDTTFDATTVAVRRKADLSITKTDGVTEAIQGNTLTYTLVASNAGPNAVTGASITDPFAPATYAVASITWTCALTAGAGDCDTGAAGTGASGTGNISLANVQLDGGASVTVTATVPLAPSFTGTASNTASVAMPAGDFDPVAGNDSATDTTTVSPPFAVTKVSAVISDPYSGGANPKRIPGAVIQYMVSIDNSAGTVTAGNVVVTDVIPAGTTYVAGSMIVNGVAEDDDNVGADETDPNGGDFNLTAVNTVTARIASLAPAASATVVFRVTVD